MHEKYEAPSKASKSGLFEPIPTHYSHQIGTNYHQLAIRRFVYAAVKRFHSASFDSFFWAGPTPSTSMIASLLLPKLGNGLVARILGLF